MKKIYYADLLGKQFVYGGRGPDVYDCYGLAIEVCRRAGIVLPEWQSVSKCSAIHSEIQKGMVHLREISGPQPYCLITLTIRRPWTSHMGVLLWDRLRFIHILYQSSVTVERIDSLEWQNRITGFYEVLQ